MAAALQLFTEAADRAEAAEAEAANKIGKAKATKGKAAKGKKEANKAAEAAEGGGGGQGRGLDWALRLPEVRHVAEPRLKPVNCTAHFSLGPPPPLPDTRCSQRRLFLVFCLSPLLFKTCLDRCGTTGGALKLARHGHVPRAALLPAPKARLRRPVWGGPLPRPLLLQPLV